ncbi:class I SAM-dependent methyltransferase [Myxococcus sp. K15C18031901]|uniref:SAM-dependent methyltransferase n=1 Tax=Myxococcus dinghuensis TaxID=2906761 RepID=UPI0020A7BE23|nr:class I SAM-dependent methyltransferase [Myxococcus dinghuensis]MCP3103017.1 class I SAM-dependent methyltransferase [Myxococcus dinghuensis]
MAEDAPTPPARTPRDEDDDYAVSLPRLVVIRLSILVIEFVTRLGDLAVLALRPRLLGPYLGLWLREVLVSPYRLRRSFELIRLLQASGQRFNELMYGETPVHTALWLFRKAGLGPGGKLLDLGAGRGRTLLAARWLGAEATGIELLDFHVALAAKPLAKTGARLVAGDANCVVLPDATHVFLNWTALSPETRARLVTRLRACPPGTRVLTVTRPIQLESFVVLSRHHVLFTWGLEHVWLHEHQPHPDTKV